MDIAQIKRDIVIDKYGDLALDYGDIKSTEDKELIAKCNSMHRIMSAYSDMRQYPLYGASLEEFIGKKINADLLKSVDNRIRKCLTEDRFLSDGDIDVIAISNQNEIFIKVSVSQGMFNNINSEFNISFDIIDGTVYVF